MKLVEDNHSDEDTEEDKDTVNSTQTSPSASDAPPGGGKGKCMGELVSSVVSKEKEDLDEIILTKTKLDKGIQISLDLPPAPPPLPKTVSKGIQVGESKEECEASKISNASPPPAPPPPPGQTGLAPPP